MAESRKYELKAIHADAVGAALEKMERYRLLNEPEEAESICRDILRQDPEFHEARIGLLLCLSDQFRRDLTRYWTEAWQALETLDDGYERCYYEGILCERRAKAHYRADSPQSGRLAHGWLEKAMACFERAIETSPPGNDSARLRWNSCARMIMKHPDIEAAEPETRTPELFE